MAAERQRCPECNAELFKARARDVTWVADGVPLLPVDTVYCQRCGWGRFATVDDDLDSLRQV